MSVENNGWLPIETAPKDGTEVILYAPDDGVYSGWFDTWDDFMISKKNISGWVTDWNDEFQVANNCIDPTHWQPLPEPPQ